MVTQVIRLEAEIPQAPGRSGPRIVGFVGWRDPVRRAADARSGCAQHDGRCMDITANVLFVVEEFPPYLDDGWFDAPPLDDGVGRARWDGLAEGLEACGIAAVVLDPTGRAVAVTRAARPLLSEDLALVDGRLAAIDPRARRRLDRIVREAAGASPTHEPLQLAVDRDGRRPLLVTAIPLDGPGGRSDAVRHAIVVLTDLDEMRAAPAETLMALFGLTRAEARLARKLADGAGLGSAAAHLGVSRNTVHSQVRAVFAKLGVSRQAELAGLLGRLDAALRRSE